MSEDKSKKPKIDLKARLGKSGVGSGSSVVPLPTPGQPNSSLPPSTTSGIPIAGGVSASGIAPPAGMSSLSPGIPMPPFGAPVRTAAPQAPKSSAAQQQTIKVEIGEEVHEERKKASKRTAFYALLTALVGLGIGFVAGGSKSKSDRAHDAARGAGLLSDDIKGTKTKMEELTEKLRVADEKFNGKQFPQELTAELAGINIPFDAMNLEGKNVGSLPSKVLRSLLAYTSAIEDLNKSKDSLKNTLIAAKAPVEKAWKEEGEPVVGFSVVFRNDQKGTVAELVTNKEPFALKGGDWPGSYSITKLEVSQAGRRQVEKKASRWTKGDLTPGQDTIAIPVDPPSVAAFTSDEIVFKLRRGMRDMRQVLEGNKDDPTKETPGLLKEGEDLAHELYKISLSR